MLSGPHYIPDSPIYTLVATLFFTLPYILPTYGDTGTAASRGPSPEPVNRCQNQSTVARTSRPSPEPDDNRSNDQPANTTNDSIDRSNRTRASISARHRIE